MLNFKKCPITISVIVLAVLLSVGLAMSPAQASEPVIQGEIDVAVTEEKSTTNVVNNRSWWNRLWNLIDIAAETPYINPLSIAVSYTDTQGRLLDTSEILVQRDGRQVWFVSIFAHDTGILYEVYVDAQTGEIVRLESSE